MLLLGFLCAFWCFWCFWCVRNLFVKKKEFKTALIPSFILLLKFILLQARIFKSQPFSIITIFFNHYNLFQLSQTFFNYHNLFQLSRPFSVITIFFNYHELLYYNLFYHYFILSYLLYLSF